MKKINYKIAIAGFLTGSVLFFVFHFTACTSPSNEKETSTVTAKNIMEEKASGDHSCCAAIDSKEYTDNSIYQLKSVWKDQNNSEFEIGQLKGNPVVFTMFFASCTYACPILINDMQRIEKELPEDELAEYKFVLVSIDPERDTPAALKRFSNNYHLDEDRWILLTGNPDNVMELAALLGFKYKKESDGSYSHSNLINILNEEGEIIYQHKGLNKDIALAVTELKNL